jgi:subtilisin family serine protease
MKTRHPVIAGIFTLVCMLSFTANAVGPAPHVGDYAYKAGELLVKFKSSVAGQAAADVAREHGAIKVEAFKRPHQLNTSPLDRWRLFRFDQGVDIKKVLERLMRDPRVEIAQFNYRYTVNVIPNDPQFSVLWGLHNTGQSGGTIGADIHAPEAWDITQGSSTAIVAVLDSGVDYTHPDLVANMWTNPGEIPGNGVDDDGNDYVDDLYGVNAITGAAVPGNPMDDHGHGTHVAGTVAAVGNNSTGVVGVSWNARIMAIKILDTRGVGYTGDAVQGIMYALDQGARILNNSYGTYSYDAALLSAIQTANDAGALFVAAAGNDGYNNDLQPYYPASHNVANVLAVEATDRNDNRAWFSNYGYGSVGLGAPGVDILSTVPTTGNACCVDPSGYKSMQGTSMATPHVAGAAALLLAQDPGRTAGVLKGILMYSADRVSSLTGTTQTGARLNAQKGLTCDPTKLVLDWQAPQSGFILFTGEPTTLRARVLTCGGLVSDTTVTATFSDGGPAITLYDDGSHGDDAPGDGLYGGVWTPANVGSVTVTLTAVHASFGTVSASRTGEIRRRVTYRHEAAAFQWIDATAGTAYTLADEGSVTIPLGLDFNFYGIPRSSVTVHANGFLTFGGTGAASVNMALPNPELPNDMIAPYWDDLNPAAGGRVHVLLEGTAPQRQLTIAWVNVPHYGGTNPASFEATLYESSGDIVFQYQDVDFGDSSLSFGANATVGLENPDGLDATLYSFNQPVVQNGTARRFITAAASDMVSYRVTVNVSGIAVSTGAIAIDMTNGDGVNNNQTQVIQFSTNGSMPDGARLIGDASGSFTPGPGRVGDAQFFNEISQPTIYGGTLSFVMSVSVNGAYAPFPDAVSFYLLDANGMPYGTDDPLGTDALFVVEISGNQPQPSIYNGGTGKATVDLIGKPVAVAGGPYSVLLGNALTLDGSGSYDPEGAMLVYSWDFGDGTTGSGARPTHRYASPGTYNVTLVVSDGRYVSSRATTTAQVITVIADAGPDQTVFEFSNVQLDGSGSLVVAGATPTYAWTQLSGPPASLSGANTAKPAFSAPDVGQSAVLTFHLTVTGANGQTSTDTVTITVLDLLTDTDAGGLPDGLPDAWEMFYFGHLDFTATGDPDGDGLSNLQEYKEGSNPAVPDPAPSAVTAVTVVPGEREVVVRWSKVLRAARYDLYWSTTAGVSPLNGTQIANVATPYVHKGLTNGTTYHYVIVASNNSGSAAPSPQASGTPNPRLWHDTRILESRSDDVTYPYPSVAMDSAGNGMAVWQQSDGVAPSVWFSRYTAGSGWGAPVLLETAPQPTGGPFFEGLMVGMDDQGNAMAVWTQNDATDIARRWYSYYQPATGWGPAQMMGDSRALRLVMAKTGHAAMVSSKNEIKYEDGWQTGTGMATVYVTRVSPGGAWVDKRVDFEDFGSSDNPSVAITDSGSLVVAWTRMDYARVNNNFTLIGRDVYVVRYIAGSGWTAPVSLVRTTDSLGDAKVGLDAQGNAVVTWIQNIPAGGTSTTPTLRASRLQGTGNWTAAETLSKGKAAGAPSLVMNAAGQTMVVWSEAQSRYARQATAGGAWGPATATGSYTGGGSISMDDAGNVAMLSSLSNGTVIDLYASYYQAGGGWSAPTLLEQASGNVTAATLSTGAWGDTAVLWTQSDGTRSNLWAARRAIPDASVPANVAPTASAGSAQTVKQGTPVTLSGTASDADGQIVAYTWKQTAGPAVTLSAVSNPVTGFTAPAVTKTTALGFELTVVDNRGAVASATVTITVTK